MINCLDDNVRVELGKSTAQGGEAALVSLERAIDDLKNGKINVLITARLIKRIFNRRNLILKVIRNISGQKRVL
jgi:4-hydroxythreonine-4-phosphate dehydrogenase